MRPASWSYVVIQGNHMYVHTFILGYSYQAYLQSLRVKSNSSVAPTLGGEVAEHPQNTEVKL